MRLENVLTKTGLSREEKKHVSWRSVDKRFFLYMNALKSWFKKEKKCKEKRTNRGNVKRAWADLLKTILCEIHLDFAKLRHEWFFDEFILLVQWTTSSKRDGEMTLQFFFQSGMKGWEWEEMGILSNPYDTPLRSKPKRQKVHGAKGGKEGIDISQNMTITTTTCPGKMIFFSWNKVFFSSVSYALNGKQR